MPIRLHMTPRRAALVAGGLVAQFLLPWETLSGTIGAWIGVPVAVAWTIVVPGWAMARLLRVDAPDHAVRAANIAGFGLFVAMGTAFIWAVADTSSATFGVLLAAATVALVFLAPRRDGTRVREGRAASRAPRIAAGAVFGLLVLLVTLTLWSGAPLEYQRDTLDYIAWVDEVAATGQAFPLTEFYRDAGADGADLRKGLLHALYGYYKWWLGADTAAVFGVLAAACLLAAALIVYASTLLLVGNTLIALLCTLTFLLLYDGGPSSDLIRSWFYPSRFGAVLLLALSAALVDLVRRPTPRRLILCAIAAFTAATVHVQYAALGLFAAGIVFTWKATSPVVGWKPHLRLATLGGVAIACGVIPFGVFRYLTAYQANDLHAQVQGAVFIWRNWFIVDPAVVWGLRGPGLLAALLCLPLLWRHRRENAGIGFALAATLTVVLIQFNPLVVTPLYNIITYLVHRLDQIAPWFMLPAVAAVVLATRRPRGGAALLAGGGVLVALIASLVSLARLPDGLGVSPAARARAQTHSPRHFMKSLENLRTILPDSTVIVSDPITSYAVTAFTPYFVVCTLDQHAPPNDRYAPLRMVAARDILSPFSSPSLRADLMRAFRATHLLLNAKLPSSVILDYWNMDAHHAELTRVALSRHPDLFRRTPLEDGVWLYELTDEPVPSTAVSHPFLVRGIPAQAKRVGQPAGEADVVAAVLPRAPVQRATPLRVSLYWSRSRTATPGKYVTTIRLDAAGLDLPFGGRPFPKIARKLKEATDGQRYRARSDHMIAGGFFGPDAWPDGAIVYDDARFEVPPDLAPGRYVVRAKLILQAHAPNYRLRDFFFDDDVFHGVSVGEVVIE